MAESEDLEFRKTVLKRVSFDRSLFFKELKKAKNALKTLEEQNALNNFVAKEFPQYYSAELQKNSKQLGKLG